MKSPKIYIGIFLVLHLAGCTAYRPAEFPGSYSSSELQEQDKRVLLVGDSVRVTLKSGTIHTGNIVDISSDEIVIGKTGNFGYEERTINLSEIAATEAEGVESPLGLLRDTVIIAGVVLGTAIILIFASGGPGFN